MDNNDVLARIRYALDLKNNDMLAIFKLGGKSVDKETLIQMLTRTKDLGVEEDAIKPEHQRLDARGLEMFLNGLIIFKRGPQPAPANGKSHPEFIMESDLDINNVIMKKLKIALALRQEDIEAIFKKVELTVSGAEITAFLRKKGHKHYRNCGDNFTRNFLLGMAKTYREK